MSLSLLLEAVIQFIQHIKSKKQIRRTKKWHGEISSCLALARLVKFILNASYTQINPITQIDGFNIMDNIYKTMHFMCQCVQKSKHIHRHTSTCTVPICFLQGISLYSRHRISNKDIAGHGRL